MDYERSIPVKSRYGSRANLWGKQCRASDLDSSFTSLCVVLAVTIPIRFSTAETTQYSTFFHAEAT
jgi:hypothetical protein